MKESKKAKKKSRIAFQVFAGFLVLTAVFLGILVACVLDRNSFIDSRGIREYERTFRMLKNCTIFAAGGTISFFLWFVYNVRNIRENSERTEKTEQNQEKNPTDRIRKQLKRFKDSLRKIEEEVSLDIIKNCDEKLDIIDDLQERLATLIETNDARYVKNSIEVLDKLEEKLCLGSQAIINLCISVNRPQDLNKEKIVEIMKKCRSITKRAQALVSTTTDAINQQLTKDIDDDSSIRAYEKVLQDCLKEIDDEFLF